MFWYTCSGPSSLVIYQPARCIKAASIPLYNSSRKWRHPIPPVVDQHSLRTAEARLGHAKNVPTSPSADRNKISGPV